MNFCVMFIDVFKRCLKKNPKPYAGSMTNCVVTLISNTHDSTNSSTDTSTKSVNSGGSAFCISSMQVCHAIFSVQPFLHDSEICKLNRDAQYLASTYPFSNLSLFQISI